MLFSTSSHTIVLNTFDSHATINYLYSNKSKYCCNIIFSFCIKRSKIKFLLPTINYMQDNLTIVYETE
uniref:Uncharacterized protein n=1 Tax=Octopus bimaculoides TaxID=37653 RepID=A0A0L8FWV7_OCTBM